MLGHVCGTPPGARGVEATNRLVEIRFARPGVQREERLLQGPLVEDDDQAGHPVADRDQLETPDPGGPRLGRGGDAGGVRRRGERRGGQAEPLVGRVLHLSELVADHELLDGRERDVAGEALDVEAIAGVGRHAARRRVRVHEEALGLELGEDRPDRGGADPQAMALHERL